MIQQQSSMSVSKHRRKLRWFTKPRRIFHWIIMFALLFFLCIAIFGTKMHFHDEMDTRVELDEFNDDIDASTATTSNPSLPADVVRQNSGSNPPKRRKKHYPCEVAFSKPVDYLLEPTDYMNFSKFPLDYIHREDNSFENGLFEPKFGGHQILEERDKSFHAENQPIHCGFVQGPPGFPTSGFLLDEKDREHMDTCKVVVSSCIFGSSDYLRRPSAKLISEFSKTNVCFVMFLDEETLLQLSSEGNIPDDRGYMGLWRIVVVKNLPYKDMRKTGKVPKLLAHRLFPSARYSIWIDSKMRLVADPMQIIEHFLWQTKSEFAISNHYDRHCVWDEVQQNKRLQKYNETVIDEQFNFYQSDGLTKFDPSDPYNLLPSYVPEGSFIIRAHTPMSNLFSCLWFNEVDRFTSRDQISFGYTYLKLRRTNPDRPFYLNMFKDCERRGLTHLYQHRRTIPPPAHLQI